MTVTSPNSTTKTMRAVQFIVAASLRPVMQPDDQDGGDDEPEELVPVEERDTPQGRLNRVVGRHPQEGDERHREQPPPPAGHDLARIVRDAAHRGTVKRARSRGR